MQVPMALYKFSSFLDLKDFQCNKFFTPPPLNLP